MNPIYKTLGVNQVSDEAKNFIQNLLIKDQYKMNNKLLVIVHGKSSNVLKAEVHRVLKENQYVSDFKLDNWNIGSTIVNLKD